MSIYLYIKTHQTTGLKYFGKTTNENPYKYKGSGKYWKLHLRKHGNLVDTEVLGYFTKDEVEPIALNFSKDNRIVESDDWANLIEENGLDGGAKGTSLSESHKAKVSAAQKGKKRGPLSAETKAKMSVAHKGKSLSAETKAKISEKKRKQID